MYKGRTSPPHLLFLKETKTEAEEGGGKRGDWEGRSTASHRGQGPLARMVRLTEKGPEETRDLDESCVGYVAGLGSKFKTLLKVWYNLSKGEVSTGGS